MGRWPSKFLVLTLLLTGWLCPANLGFGAKNYYSPVMPKDLSKLEVSLITAGYGEDIYQLWGHTALRFKDTDSGTDVVANWGFFDFDAPNFAWNFFRGILTYRLGFQTYDDTVRTYVYEQRSLWEDKLNLTAGQKEKLLTKLIWNAQPENRGYNYMYFFDNCSTRPRDFLDLALGGAFQNRFGKGISDFSFRDKVRQHMAPQPFSSMALDVLMNDRLDRPMTIWEEMFLPVPLRTYLGQMPAIDDAGKPRLGEALFNGSKQVLSYKIAQPPSYSGFHMVVLPLAFLLCLCLALGAIGGTPAKSSGSGYSGAFMRTLGAISLLWGAFFGAFGLIMAVAWVASEHLDLQHNGNLWLFWPTDLALLWLGGRWLVFGSKRPVSQRLKDILKVYSMLHLFGFGLLVTLTFVGVLHQDTRLVTSYFGPLLVFFWGLILRKVGMDRPLAMRSIFKQSTTDPP